VLEEVQFPYVGGWASGGLLRPQDEGRHGAIILFLGINPNLEDETLHRVARALARAGMVVLLPKPAQLVEGRASYEEVETLIGAFRFLQDRSYVDPKRIGFAGFCVGSSLALIAAGDPRISNEVRFVNFFGGYFSAQGLLAAMTTRRIAFDGLQEPWEPSKVAFAWFAQQLIGSVPESDSRSLLERTVLKEQQLGTDELGELSPQGRSVYQVLANRDPQQVAALYGALSQELKASFARLSPSTALDWLQAKVYIMHDRNDTYVPYVESRRLAAALAEHPRKHYTEFAIFQHMHPQRTLETRDFVGEVIKLYYHLYLLMLEVL
jgi:dienelactone hydrolase